MFVELTNKINDCPDLEMRIIYNKGGINYYNYKNEKQGYYLHVQPCKRIKKKDYTVVEYPEICNPEVSFKVFILDRKRDNPKTYIKLLDILHNNGERLKKFYEDKNLTLFEYYCNEIFGKKEK